MTATFRLGLIASTAHALLSRAALVDGIIGTRMSDRGEDAAKAVTLARALLAHMRLADRVPACAWASQALNADGMPQRSPGTDAIIREAMRTDTTLPLYLTVGGGLTEVAGADMPGPQIAGRFTPVWIGMTTVGASGTEYNTITDPLAAKLLVNQTNVRIWAVPQDADAQCLVSTAKLRRTVAKAGQLGQWLMRQVDAFSNKLAQDFGSDTGAADAFGDGPLVLLTALAASVPDRFDPPFRYDETGASHDQGQPTCPLTEKGFLQVRAAGRPMGVYRTLDIRRMFADFFSGLANTQRSQTR